MINRNSQVSDQDPTRDTNYSTLTDESNVSTINAQDVKDAAIMGLTKDSWAKRTFGPMQKGSIRSSIIALLSCTMGSGMLAFPSNAKSSGFILSALLMFFGAIISRLCMTMLMEASFKTGALSYTEQVEIALGKIWRRVFEADVIFYVFGVAVCMQIMFSSLLWESCSSFGVNSDYKNLFILIVSLSFIVLNFPITMLKDVYQLRYFAMLQLLVIIYVNIAMFVYFIIQFDWQKIQDEVLFFELSPSFFSAFATTLYGYICHQLLFPLRSELKRSSMRRMTKVCNRTVFLTFMIYIVVMNSGYFTWLDDTKPLVISNYSDLHFAVVKSIFALALFFSVPININPMRLTLLECIGKTDSKQVYFISTFLIQVLSGILGYVYPNVKSGFGFLGGFLGTNIMIAFPCLIYVKVFGWNKKSIFFTIICSIVTLFGYTGSVMSLVQK